MADQSDVHDVVMIGAGPSALAAAIYTTREDIETLLLEKGAIGGLAAITDLVENYPGFPEGVSGLELSERLRKQAERFGAKFDYREVTGIKTEGALKVVTTNVGDVKARAVLVATGNDYKHIGAPGEEEFLNKGVHYCATCDGPLYKGKKLLVVGGGNSAAQESLFLAKLASQVDILIRKGAWKASEILIKEIANIKNITVHFNTEVEKIEGPSGLVSNVVTKNNQTNESTNFAVDGVFVFVGLVPNTQFLKGSGVALNELGFVVGNNRMETNVPGVFVSGDVRAGATEQIASAVGEGAVAALSIREYLHSSTVNS